MMNRHRLPASLIALYALSFAGVLAETPLDLIPGDALLCWKGEPFPEFATSQSANSGETSALATLIDAGTRIAGAPLRAKQKFALRLVEGFGAAARKPFALAILDAQAKPTDDGQGKRVDKLQVALVVKTDGKNEPFLKIVQKAVNELTDQGQATLQHRTAEKWKYDELSDKRLSETIAWGVIGDHFVIAYGPDVWPRVAEAAAEKTTSLARDKWLAGVRKKNPASSEPLIEVFLAARAVRQRLDPLVDGRASRFFQAMSAANVTRAHWALGFKGRALYCVAHFYDENETVERVFADPEFANERVLAPIPPDARYAIYRLHLPYYVPRLFGCYYATREERDRAAAERFWARIQAELHFDGQKDLIDHLGDTIILHNDPPHPLKLPLAFTSLIEIRGDAKAVRETIERLLTAWQKHLSESEESEDAGWTRLERDNDGVWYMQYGPIAGLAWTVTDRYIVTSWSPAALRDSVAKLNSRLKPPAEKDKP